MHIVFTYREHKGVVDAEPNKLMMTDGSLDILHLIPEIVFRIADGFFVYN